MGLLIDNGPKGWHSRPGMTMGASMRSGCLPVKLICCISSYLFVVYQQCGGSAWSEAESTDWILIQTHDIHPEPIRTSVKPDPHHPPQLLPQLWVLPVQVRLFLEESVEVVLLRRLVVLPG
jgi:hypothetical protein